MAITQIGVDVAKSVFEAAISPAPGVVASRRRRSRRLGSDANRASG